MIKRIIKNARDYLAAAVLGAAAFTGGCGNASPIREALEDAKLVFYDPRINARGDKLNSELYTSLGFSEVNSSGGRISTNLDFKEQRTRLWADMAGSYSKYTRPFGGSLEERTRSEFDIFARYMQQIAKESDVGAELRYSNKNEEGLRPGIEESLFSFKMRGSHKQHEGELVILTNKRADSLTDDSGLGFGFSYGIKPSESLKVKGDLLFMNNQRDFQLIGGTANYDKDRFNVHGSLYGAFGDSDQSLGLIVSGGTFIKPKSKNDLLNAYIIHDPVYSETAGGLILAHTFDGKSNLASFTLNDYVDAKTRYALIERYSIPESQRARESIDILRNNAVKHNSLLAEVGGGSADDGHGYFNVIYPMKFFVIDGSGYFSLNKQEIQSGVIFVRTGLHLGGRIGFVNQDDDQGTKRTLIIVGLNLIKDF